MPEREAEDGAERVRTPVEAVHHGISPAVRPVPNLGQSRAR
jgi:hypothetical protein